MNQINDWWNRYVPVSERPRKSMQAYRPKPVEPVSKDVHDIQRYVELSMLIRKKDCAA